jgi:hypothetical protein
VNKAVTTLWFLLDLHPDVHLTPDPVEFSGYGWFRRTEVAGWRAGQSDPQMARALAKLDAQRQAAPATRTRHAGR